MAIIYTYNTALPALDDILLGTEKDATLRNPTKNFKIGDLAKFIIDSQTGTNLSIPLFFDVADPITGLVQTTLVDSIMTQDVNPNGTTLTIAGNISVTGTFADSTGATGTANQVLTSTVTGTAWALVSASTEIIPFNNVAVVTANHTGALGTFPSITVVNNNNIVLYGEVRYITTTQITVTFASPQTGTLYLN
jgi:hypothetical protein|tara:strand:+ start:671 stop:1249 length:579 start_codon:yes stop_codon:yes gene_type:complete